jgi:hypothetical protein
MQHAVRRAVCLLTTACALAAPALAQPGGPLPGPLPLFPTDNWWNVDVSNAPVEPRAAEFLAFIGDDRLHPDFGGDSGDEPEIYGLPYVSVPGSQPLVPVDFDYADESDPGAPGRPPGYPIPEDAKTQAKWIEGGYPGNADVGGDRHLLLVDRDHRLLYELYAVRWDASLGRWQAGSGAVFPLAENRRRPEGWTSADAAGLAILPGLVRYDEAYGGEPIRHAYRFTVHDSNGYVFPASHDAGDSPHAPPLGTRLRLVAGKDISGFPEPVRRVFQAMKTYGLILADNGSDMYVSGTYDRRWDNDVLNPAFGALRASDFEVIELGWQPDDGPPPPPPSCTASDTTLCLRDGRYRVEASWRRTNGTNGPAHALALTANAGTFWFFAPQDPELLIRVVDGCSANGNVWVFAAGVTNVRVDITVTDTTTGAVKQYVNPQRRLFRTVQDTHAFGCP